MMIQLVRRMTAALAIAAIAPGCSEVFGPGYDYATIEVLALDQAGAPVVGMPLILYGKGQTHSFGTTDAEGRHLFRYVPFGGFGVAANAPEGYVFPGGGDWEHRYADVGAGDARTVEFIVTRPVESGS